MKECEHFNNLFCFGSEHFERNPGNIVFTEHHTKTILFSHFFLNSSNLFVYSFSTWCFSSPIKNSMRRRTHVFECLLHWSETLAKMQLRLFLLIIWIKPSRKSIITRKKALLRVTIFSFSGQTYFHLLILFKTLKMLHTAWKFACTL